MVIAWGLTWNTDGLHHTQNTGGFFICLLKKVAPTPPEPEKPNTRKNWRPKCTSGEKSVSEAVKSEDASSAPAEVTEDAKVEDVKVEDVKDEDVAVADADAADTTAMTETATADETAPAAAPSERALRRREERKNRAKTGDEYVDFSEEQWREIQAYYAISDAFSRDQLITRSGDAKSVTFVTQSISMPLLEEMKQRKYKVVYAGLKMFERNDSQASGRVFRLCQAGLAHIMPFMNQRKAQVSPREFQMLLDRLGDLMDFDEFEPATRDMFAAAPIGSIVCSLERPNQSLVECVPVTAAVYRSCCRLTNRECVSVRQEIRHERRGLARPQLGQRDGRQGRRRRHLVGHEGAQAVRHGGPREAHRRAPGAREAGRRSQRHHHHRRLSNPHPVDGLHLHRPCMRIQLCTLIHREYSLHRLDSLIPPLSSNFQHHAVATPHGPLLGCHWDPTPSNSV
jgi:hypothetical protein